MQQRWSGAVSEGTDGLPRWLLFDVHERGAASDTRKAQAETAGCGTG